MALLISGVTRVQKQPMSVLVAGDSASGKSRVCRSVLEYFPKGSCTERSRVTAAGLESLVPELDHKVLFLSELMAAHEADYVMRVLISEGRLATTLGSSRGAARTMASEAAVVVWTTTALDKVEPQLESRLLEIAMDDSLRQTESVLERMAKSAATIPNMEGEAQDAHDLEVWRRALAKIGPASIVVPQADGLTGQFSGAPTRARRDFSRLLSLVKGLTLLHQRQRHPLSGSGALVAADQDVTIALNLWRSRCIGVNAQANVVLDRLSAVFGDQPFSATEAARPLGYAADTIRRKVKELVDLGWIEPAGNHRGRVGARWRLVSATPGVRELTPCRTEADASRAYAGAGYDVGRVAGVQ